MDKNADLSVLSLPREWDAENLKKFLKDVTELEAKDIFLNDDICMKEDTRQGERNSGGKQAIFTCKSKPVAEEVIEKF